MLGIILLLVVVSFGVGGTGWYALYRWGALLLCLGGVGFTLNYGMRQIRKATQRDWNALITQEVIGSIQDAIVVVDAQEKMLYANHAFEALTGYTFEEIKGQSSRSMVHPGQLQERDPDEIIRQVIQGQSQEADWQVRRKDGSFVWLNITTHRLYDAVTQEVYVMGIGRDISQAVDHQAALEEEKRKFEFFVESLPHLMWIYEPNGRFTYVNGKLRRFFQNEDGQGVDNLEESVWLNSIHLDDRPQVLQVHAEVAERGEPYSFDARLWKAAEARYVWVRFQGVPLLSEKGEIQKWYGTGTEIDQLMITRQRLDDRERLYRSLVESQSTFFMRLRPDGSYAFANSALVKKFYPEGGTEHSMGMDLIHADDLGIALEVGEWCVENLYQMREVILRKQLPTGAWAYVEWEFMGMYDEGKDEIFVQGIGRDITERYQIEQERKTLSLIVENTDHGVVVLDQDVCITWANQAFSDISGYRLDQLVGRHPADLLVGPLTPKEDIARVDAALEAGEPLHMELIKYNSQGQPFWAEFFLQPIRDERGKLVSYFALERNISEEKRQRLELQQVAQELAHRNERLSDFAYQVSHDLRGSLANIKGMAQIVLEDVGQYLEPNVMRHLQNAIAQLEHVILDMQRNLDTPMLASEPWQTTSFQEVYEMALQQLSIELSQTPIEWKLDFSRGPLIHAPLAYVQSMLYNFISNAIKYRSPERSLIISLASWADGSNLTFEVKDNGRGLDLDKVKEKLFRLRSRFHSDVEGTGMGLYLVRQHVEQLGGNIEVESAPDQGATFRVSLPHSAA